MVVPKKHHFVPRWYLERFADANGYLIVYDRHTPRFRRQKPKNVMTVTHYYRQLWAPIGIDPNVLEKSLGATLEQEAKTAIEILLSAPQTLNEQQVADILVFLELQRVRVPRQAAHAKELLRSTLFMNSPRDVQQAILEGSLQITVKDSFRFEYMRMLIGSLNPWFGRMKWEIIKAATGTSFITTDSPVSFYNVDFLPPTEAGIGLTGTRVFYPLDSYHLLIMGHPEYLPTSGGASLRLPDPKDAHGRIEITSGIEWNWEQVLKMNWVMYQLADRVIVANGREVLEQCLGS